MHATMTLYATVWVLVEDILICEQKLLQDRYQLHRITRNGQQKAKILDESFTGWILDEHLVKLDGPQKDSSYEDPRHCLVFWARPPVKVRNLVEIIQQKLQDAAPGRMMTFQQTQVAHLLKQAEQISG
jgi:hypothetical protein